MTRRLALTLFLLSFNYIHSAHAQTVTLLKKDAVVWLQEQTIHGVIDTTMAREGLLHAGEESLPFTAANGSNTFSVPVALGDGTTAFVAEVQTADGPVHSDTLRLTMGYVLRPVIEATPTASGRSVTLSAAVLENPFSAPLSFTWSADPGNPAPVSLPVPDGPESTTSIPTGSPPGEYFFNVAVDFGAEKPVHARTLVTVTDSAIVPFDIRTDRSQWINDAVLYQVTPYNLVQRGTFVDVTAKIPEIAALGINTLYLQPIYTADDRGQGYGILNHFEIRSDYGTAHELRTLIQTARDHGMRVLFDFVPGHLSISHAYAQDAVTHGAGSHYYDFFQRENDGVRYARHYNSRTVGEMDFIYYFWDRLVNLNVNHPEMRRWIIEAITYWVEEFGIDGYRLDATWGPNARNPAFMQEVRLALKRIKPELLIIGEDKASRRESFEERYDAAYDWTSSESWVSQWAWEVSYINSYNENRTVFNYIQPTGRSYALRYALTNTGSGYHPRAKILRYMENNDLPRFIRSHGPERTRMAAAFLFGLHGIPMMYQGQEIGYLNHPYQTSAVFQRNESIASLDTQDLLPFYQHLIATRARVPALRSDHFAEIPVSPQASARSVYVFHRWENDEHVFVALNMDENDAAVTLQLPAARLPVEEGITYYLTDLLTGTFFPVTRETLAGVNVQVPAYTAQWWILADEPVQVSTRLDLIASPTQTMEIEQNYPNPFTTSTSIRFVLPHSGRVVLQVVDLLGRTVATLVDENREAGVHSAVFHAEGLAGGVYICRLSADGRAATKRMVLLH